MGNSLALRHAPVNGQNRKKDLYNRTCTSLAGTSKEMTAINDKVQKLVYIVASTSKDKSAYHGS